VRLTVAADGTRKDIAADHVIMATGYRPDLARLDFLDEDIRSALRTLSGSALVGRGYQSSVPGLYAIGPLVAPSFGPVMRFVYGARHAALAVTRQLASGAGHPAPDMAASR
jgi:FAD-dependent urate hydroxylase